MKKELLLSILLATGSMAASFESAAEWQDRAGETPEEPPEELRAAAAAAAAAAAPGAIPAATPAPLVSEPAVLPAPVAAPPSEEIRSVAPVVSTWNTTKAYAVVLRPVSLRARPVASGRGDPIEAETRVRLESSTVNADGTWWFVTAAGVGGGWLLESEMGSPQR